MYSKEDLLKENIDDVEHDYINKEIAHKYKHLYERKEELNIKKNVKRL